MTDHSKCCNDTVRVGGEGETHYYICNRCDKPCDVQDETDLREVVAKWFRAEGYLDSDLITESFVAAASLLSLLSQHGVVRLYVDDQVGDALLKHGIRELLYAFRKNGGDLEFCVKTIMQDFEKANFKRVRPLEAK